MAKITFKGSPINTIDEKGEVIYTQLVKEIAEEPDYEKALKVLR